MTAGKDHLPTAKIGAVLLAAGQGSRIGNLPKALLRLEGVPLIDRHLDALDEIGASSVVVVCGFYHACVEPLIRDRRITMVRNRQPDQGQPSSVRLGIEAIGSQCDAVIMMLCDQPLIEASDLIELLDAFEARQTGEVVVPRVHGQRGNPIVFSGTAIGEILRQGPDMYCRRYMDENPALVSYFETGNERYVTDIDTVADLDAFEKKWKLKLELPPDLVGN